MIIEQNDCSTGSFSWKFPEINDADISPKVRIQVSDIVNTTLKICLPALIKPQLSDRILSSMKKTLDGERLEQMIILMAFQASHS